jgi:ribosomal protein S18 acetylase RimI-like enzyme
VEPVRIGPLDPTLDRDGFRSGVAALDRYFHQQVSQDIRRRVTACFVAQTITDGRPAGYYTLASSSVLLNNLPAPLAKKLPRYPSVPAIRMRRLAVDENFMGQGLGGVLLADALLRVQRSEIAAFALVVDAKDDSAASFYCHHGFMAMESHTLTLFLPLASAPPTR